MHHIENPDVKDMNEHLNLIVFLGQAFSVCELLSFFKLIFFSYIHLLELKNCLLVLMS